MLQFSHLIDEVAVAAGTARRSGDPLRTSVGRWVNQVCRRIAHAYPWWTRQAEQEVVTVAPYTTGTADLTEASTAVAGSGTTWPASFVGRKFTKAIGGPTYRIASRASDTSIALSTAYREDTAAGTTYAIVQDEYDLVATTHRIDGADLVLDRARGPLTPATERYMKSLDYPGSRTGVPTMYALVASTTSGTPRIRLWPTPNDVYRVMVRYTPKWTDLALDADVPALPDECEELIVDGVLRNLPKMEGSRRVMPDREWSDRLREVWLRNRPIEPTTSHRIGFDRTGPGNRLLVDLGGVVTP